MRRYSRACVSLAIVSSCLCSAAARAQAGEAVNFDSALTAAVTHVLQALERAGSSCADAGSLPVVVDASWHHRAAQSALRADRGFGAFLATQLAHRLPCATALRGTDRDQALRDLQDQSQPFYSGSDGQFRRAGREFSRSEYLVSGEWWKPGRGRAVFTVQVLHLRRGERVPTAVAAGPAQWSCAIRSIDNEMIRQSLAWRVCIDVPEEFDGQTERELRHGPRTSAVQVAVVDSLGNERRRSGGVIVVADTAGADVVVSGRVRMVACPLSPIQAEILAGAPSFAYRTETQIQVVWPGGRVVHWVPRYGHDCPALRGPMCRRSQPAAAYDQAREWLISGDPRHPERESPVQWLLRTLDAL